MTSTPLGHKKCLDKWGAVHYTFIRRGEENSPHPDFPLFPLEIRKTEKARQRRKR
jgi:hypothetical protein